MVALPDYIDASTDEWRIFARRQVCSTELQDHVLALVRGQTASHHPQTIEFSHGAGQRFVLKVFHRTSLLAALKDHLRRSRAFNSWRQGIALAAAGFNAPIAVAVGKEAGWRVASREFILTVPIAGMPLMGYLRSNGTVQRASLSFKRETIIRLACLIRRLHHTGFVHGDLVATNLLLVARGTAEIEFFFMDNDRTRQYPRWLRQSFWKRNLIQLNRMPLPGISLQDRMRFLHAYLNVKQLSETDRQFARWLEMKTRQRRKECDGADPTGSFRRLMRWLPEMAGAKNGS